MDSTGSLVRCPSATSLALNLPSCLTAYTKWTLIFWKPSGMTTFPLWNCALSKYNVMVEWESGEVTYEPLTLISKDDPITCAVYAKKHDLLDTTGWKHLKRYAKTSKRLIRAVKQSRIRQVRASARYQHGFQVPKDYNDAMRLDKENGNTHWQDAMDLELTQIHEYKVFKDTPLVVRVS